MRAVLDTNVVVSALLWSGPPYRLLQAAVDGDLELFSSPVLLQELRDVLGRPHLADRLLKQRESLDDAVALYAAMIVLAEPNEVPRSVPRDPDDDHVVALAVSSQAELIVSGDRHLHELGPTYRGIRIAKPAEAVRWLRLND